MSAQLYLYHVSFANGNEIIIASVNLQAALDCAKDELLKMTDAIDVNRVRKSPCTGIKQINIGTHFAVAPEPTPSDTQGGAA